MNIFLNFNINIFINLLLYTIAVGSGIVFVNKIMAGIIDYFVSVFKTKFNAKYTDKRKLAKEVFKVCTEGASTGWTIRPRDNEHVMYLLNLLESEDRKAATFFELMVSSWSICAITQEDKRGTMEDIEFCRTLQREAQEAEKALKEIISKWL